MSRKQQAHNPQARLGPHRGEHIGIAADVSGRERSLHSSRILETWKACKGIDRFIVIWQNSQSMEKKLRARYEGRARIIKALAHPTRLFIVDELSKRERCVCELTELVGSDISTVSKHLSLLKAAGIVVDDKRGTQVFYSLRVRCVLRFFDCVSAVMQSIAEEEREALAAR
jgi:ArsR family transcriptional regulator